MKGDTGARIFYLLAATLLLLSTFSPYIAFADFISPGKPIDGGTAITPGTAISGGSFIVPGEVYDPGHPLEGGAFQNSSSGLTSGTPIMNSDPLTFGVFIIPNAPPDLPALNQLLNGQNGGQGSLGGNGQNGGQGSLGGNGQNGGQGSLGGNGQNGGQGSLGGNGQNGGQGSLGGNGQNGGQGSLGGNGQNGGQGSLGGNGQNGGQGSLGGNGQNGGQGSLDGNGQTGGQGPENGSGQVDGQTPPGSESTTSPFTQQVTDITANGKKLKKMMFTYPKKFGEILDGSLSIYAGFQIKDLNTHSGNRNLYKIMGKSYIHTPNASLSVWLNSRYHKYLEGLADNKAVLKGKQSTIKTLDENGNIVKKNIVTKNIRTGDLVKKKKIFNFIDKNTSFKNVFKKAGTELSENWFGVNNVFKASNWKSGNIINKNFFKLSKIAKGNGIMNVALSSGGRIFDYATDPNKSFLSTDFAAGMTTDVAFGVGSTAVSAAAGWAAGAAAGAAFGSVVPGLGTVVGAVAGIGIGLLLETNAGRNFKKAVETGIKKAYDGVKDFGAKMFKGVFG